MTTKTMYWRASMAFVAALALAGCQGEKGPQGDQGLPGDQGNPGDPGEQGEPGAAAATHSVESCAICHDAGRTADMKAAHALTNEVDVTGATATYATNDVVITFKILVDGVPRLDFTNKVDSYYHRLAAAATLPTRNSLLASAFTVTAPATAADDYTVRINGLAQTLGGDKATFYIRLNANATTGDPRAAIVATAPAGGARALVSDQACVNCHGNNVFATVHHGNLPEGVGACVVCHVRNDRQSRGANGDTLKAWVHGIHNSHAMKERVIGTTTKPAGVYARNDSTDPAEWFEVSFPANMNNCATCHDSDPALTAVLAQKMSYSTCLSCHDSWAGLHEDGHTSFGGTNHAGFTAATDCSSCHNSLDGAIATDYTVGDFHQEQLTERSGLLYAGKDQSIEEGKKIALEITAVRKVGANLEIDWKATNPLAADAPYDACNSDYAAGPVFFGKSGITADPCTNTAGGCNSNFTVLRAYAQGNDWVNAGMGTSPGQPVSYSGAAAAAVTPVAANTTCDATTKVATTTIAAETTTATKGIVALQGKPQVKFGPTGKVIWVRAVSPTREFVVATGAEPAAADKRRQIVSTEKCLACHPGTLYQHGGNRVDSVELCLTCHNPASNEKNNRVGMGVTAAEAYDGKAGETYDLRYMIHAIHSAGETGAPLVYYRSNGIYLWGNEATLASIPNWPGTGSKTVYGSNPAGTNTAGTTRTHNFHAVTYPRPLADCAACHVNDSHEALPNPQQAVALTVDAGAAPWGNQLDDVLMGASTASCMSCHQSGVKLEQAQIRAHASQNAWVPGTFEAGRQTVLDATK